MIEAEREDRVARLQQREVGGHVRLRAGVRLHVGVLGAEELLRPVDRELLDLVDHLAAAVVALAGIALRVLVRRHGADGLEHARPGEVLGRDQLDLPALALELAAEQPGDVRVDLLQARGAEPVERFLGDGHCRSSLAGRRSDARAPRRRPGAPRRPERPPRGGRRGSSPVRSITVDGVPGSSPPSTNAAAAARSCSGTSSSVCGSGPPGRFALVATSAPARSSTSRAGPVSPGMRTPSVSGREPASQGKRRPGLGRISVYGPGRSARATRSGAPSSSGRHSRSSVEVADDEGGRLLLDASLGEVEAANGVLVVRRRRKPVDGVGRNDRQPARRESPRPRRRRQSRRPSTTRSLPVRSGVVTTST